VGDGSGLSGFGPVLLFGAAGFVLVLVVGWFGWKAAEERRRAFAALAASRGWQWVARDDSWTERFGGEPFGRGDDRKAENVLTGTYEGRPVVAFDYSYETSSTDSKGNRTTTTHRYAVCALGLPSWLPTLELGPESLLSRFGNVLGLGDVELESEEFNRRYRVTASDPKFAYDVLHPRTMELLLARPTVSLRIAAADALAWDDGRHSVTELDERLATLHAVLEGIPSFVWNDSRGAS
jgi:hypothetical protein